MTTRLNKVVVPLLLLVLAILLVPVNEPAAAGPPESTTWEYRVFRMDPSDYVTKADYVAISKRVGPRAVEAAFTEHVLGYLGKDGWELVSVERRNKNLLYLYLKRPRK